ncbi:RNA polymerase sigma factor [Polyangium jinanense]|uniref:RNA polymerase sigma factor n=1 Tax=Polyangium jinanense TaxID=2829994 RepID=UPI0023402094|nr:sigma-70 family RNA polymerase sigma factor [Polyangium jinanense]
MIFAALAPRTATAPSSATNELDVLAVHEAQADFVWRSLQRLGIRPADLEDVFQEVFVVVHKRLHTFDGSSALTTWLFGVCLRVAAAHRRRAWFRREVPTDNVAATFEAPTGESPDAALEARRARAALDRVLDEMDLDKRAVFVMFELDELPSEEIAAILGVPVGTVWSRLSAARKQFQKIVARHKARGGSLE